MVDRPYFPFFVSDYLGKTHPGLTLEQHGCLVLLLAFSWQRPNCSLPDDDSWLATRLNIHGDKWRTLRKTVLERFFERDENGDFYSKRLRKESDFSSKSHRKAVEKVEKRWSKSKENNDIAENRHMPPHHTAPQERRSFGSSLRLRRSNRRSFLPTRGKHRAREGPQPTNNRLAKPLCSGASRQGRERREGREAREARSPPEVPAVPPGKRNGSATDGCRRRLWRACLVQIQAESGVPGGCGVRRMVGTIPCNCGVLPAAAQEPGVVRLVGRPRSKTEMGAAECMGHSPGRLLVLEMVLTGMAVSPRRPEM
jgi:uncharacterized protein YdaU (DUF1376 family)